MLLRCCTVTLLLLVGACDQCSEVIYGDCVKSVCKFHSDEDGQMYTTWLTVKTRALLMDPTIECMDGLTSHTVNAVGTVVSRVNVRFNSGLRIDEHGVVHREQCQGNLSWIPKSPFVKDFWLDHGSCVRSLSVRVYNMSLNPMYVSNLQGHWLFELELTGNSWPTTAGLFLQMPVLKKFSLAENQIEEIHPGLLKGCHMLQVLDLSRNKIRNYTNVLYNVQPARRTLTELNLAGNIISIFEYHWSYFGWQIKKLNLSRNEVSSFDLWVFPKNCEVDLTFNNITELPSYLDSLRVDRMDLAGQNFSDFFEVGFVLSFRTHREMLEYCITNMEIVYDNRLSDVNLAYLYVTVSECTLDPNFIYCNPNGSNILPTAESTFINLTGNAVKIGTTSISAVRPVNIVDLSQNILEYLEEVPWEMVETKQLNLSWNSIVYIRRDFFLRMRQLTAVDLSHNQLKHVQLTLYSTLRALDISNNKLNRMDISRASLQYTIEYLNLSHNRFTNILKAEWSQFDQFAKVDLGENNFECCSPEGQYSRTIFLHYQHKIMNINSSKALTCVRPSYGRVEMTDTWLSEDHCQFNLQGWVGFGCLVLLLPLIIHGVDLVDYFMHQTERDLAERLTRLKKQGLEEDENCALDCEYDAFVCHSHKDAAWVRYELVRNLENDRYGHRLCIHYRDFQLGSFIEENVEQAMNTSRKVIVVVTRSFLQSDWCKMELTFAWEKMVREGRNYIIVIEVDRILKGKRPPILSYLMRSRTYLEWPEAPTDEVKQQCWSRVRDALGKSLRDRQQEQSESGIVALQMDC